MQPAQGPSDRQTAVWISIGVGLAVAGITIGTFWLVYWLALGKDLPTVVGAADAPYNVTDGILAITQAQPNTPTDGRQPWLGSEAWQAGVQAGQAYIGQFPQPQNVQVLRNMDTAQIWNYMQRISGAMGVSCQYCHDINNLAADSYPQKISARLMLLLVRDLNAQYMVNLPNWRGNFVQCDTCHNGQALNVPSVSDEFNKSTPSIDVVLEPLDIQGLPIRDINVLTDTIKPRDATGAPLPSLRMGLKQATLYYYYNYFIWKPFDPADRTSGRGSLALLVEGNRTQDQVTINQNTMNDMNWSLGVGCTYCHNSRNFYAWEADIVAPQFPHTYAINRLKAQRMLLMTTFMAQNWSRYVLPRNPQPTGASFPLDGNQYLTNIDGSLYVLPGCYTCHRARSVPRAAINAVDIPAGDAGVIVLPPALSGLPSPAAPVAPTTP